MTVELVEKMDKIVLPSLSLNMLTKPQLCDLIPQLIKTVTGTGPPQFSEETRPPWWPDDIPWAKLGSMLQLPTCEVSSTELRRIVRCCYYHSGNEKELLPSEEPAAEVSQTSCDVRSQLGISEVPVSCPSTVCSKRNTRASLNMGVVCEQTRINSFSGHFTRGQRQMFSTYLRKKQEEERARARTLPPWDDAKHTTHAWWVKKHARKAAPEVHPSKRMKQEDFLCGCGLVTNKNAMRMKIEAEESHESIDLDCQIIAVEGPLSSSSVTSPRTLKSLMSQLSRDSAAAARKRISFCAQQEEGSGDDSESNSPSTNCKQAGSLLNIDFSSFLGQRLKKHMQLETSVPVIRNIEAFCKTVPFQDSVGVKLRHRAMGYPVTFRKKRATPGRHCHTFKLTGGERREFRHVLRTGLDRKSRRLQKQMKNCVVQLVRLTKSEIAYWTVKRRTVVNQEIHIDDDISIVQVDIPESSYPAVCHKIPDTIQHYGDEKNGQNKAQTKAFYTFQRLGTPERLIPDTRNRLSSLVNPVRQASPPCPQFLVKKVSKNFNGQESQRLVYVPLGDALPPQGAPVQPGNTSQPVKGSSKLPSTKNSTIPEYRRLGPKSRRKQLMAQREGLAAGEDDFTMEASVESLDEEHKEKQPQGKSSEPVYPVAVVDVSGNPVQLLTVQGEGHTVMPQLLHIAQPVSQPEDSSASTFLPQSFPITEVTLLPGQDPNLLNLHQQQLSLGFAQPISEASVQVGSKNYPLLSQQLQGVGGQSSPQPVPVTAVLCQEGTTTVPAGERTVVGMADTSESTATIDPVQGSEGESTLSIDAVYSASDLCNEQVASELGLQWVPHQEQNVVQQPARTQPPNFLLSPGVPSSSSQQPAQPPLQCYQQPQQLPVLVPRISQSPKQIPLQTQQFSQQPLLSSQTVSCQPQQFAQSLAQPQQVGQPRVFQSSQYRRRQRAPQSIPASVAGYQPSSRHPASTPSSRPVPRAVFQNPRSSVPLACPLPPPNRQYHQHSETRSASTERPGTGGSVMKARPLPVELPPVPPPLIRRAPPVHKRPQGRSQSAWHVLNAADDDVVEVICIDD